MNMVLCGALCYRLTDVKPNISDFPSLQSAIIWFEADLKVRAPDFVCASP